MERIPPTKKGHLSTSNLIGFASTRESLLTSREWRGISPIRGGHLSI